GFFNGTTDGASDDLDTSDGKDLAARVFATPFKTSGPSFLKGLGLGIAATTGSSEGTLAAPGLPSFRTGGRETFFRFRGDATEANTVVADGARRRVSPQGYWYVGPFGLLGEYVRVETEVRRAEDSRTLTNTAYNATASFVLTGEPASTKGVVPRRPLDPRGGGWGALELVARATGLEVDANTFPTFADPARSMRRATAYGAGVNWYLNRAVRALVNYERTSFDPADGAAARVDENVIVTRLQVYF
ncbi:MAG TPA: porin, partial [Longimicrobium sp.]|nr:porin [Longimicrobium sp.]